LARLDPSRAHWVNARIAEKRKDFTTAEREYRDAIAAGNGNAEAWFNLALLFKHTGRLDQMEDAIHHAVSAEMVPPIVLVDSAETLIRAGRNFPMSEQLLRRYISSGAQSESAPVFKAHYLLGIVLEKQGDKRSAAQEYRAALSLAREFSRAQEALNRLNR
jgi:Tfp pilus assembly protein PilF